MGEGNPCSPILVVGDSVRQSDDVEKKIFAKRAGLKLDSMLSDAGLKPAAVYKTLLVRCYGGQRPQFGEWEAFKRCRYHTLDLYKIMKPKALVICGLKAFKWLVIRYTKEAVNEKNFYKWMGKVIRLKEIWGETKILIIESPSALARRRQPENEQRCVEGLTEIKNYVAAQMMGGSSIPLEMLDLKTRRKNVDQQLKFGWPLDLPEPEAAPADGTSTPSS
jgi:uracil-DNA glycosylase family 4